MTAKPVIMPQVGDVWVYYKGDLSRRIYASEIWLIIDDLHAVLVSRFEPRMLVNDASRVYLISDIALLEAQCDPSDPEGYAYGLISRLDGTQDFVQKDAK